MPFTCWAISSIERLMFAGFGHGRDLSAELRAASAARPDFSSDFAATSPRASACPTSASLMVATGNQIAAGLEAERGDHFFKAEAAAFGIDDAGLLRIGKRDATLDRIAEEDNRRGHRGPSSLRAPAFSMATEVSPSPSLRMARESRDRGRVMPRETIQPSSARTAARPAMRHKATVRSARSVRHSGGRKDRSRDDAAASRLDSSMAAAASMPEFRQFGAHIPLRFGPDGKSGFGGGDILRGGVEQIRRQARRSGHATGSSRWPLRQHPNGAWWG